MVETISVVGTKSVSDGCVFQRMGRGRDMKLDVRFPL